MGRTATADSIATITSSERPSLPVGNPRADEPTRGFASTHRPWPMPAGQRILHFTFEWAGQVPFPLRCALTGYGSGIQPALHRETAGSGGQTKYGCIVVH